MKKITAVVICLLILFLSTTVAFAAGEPKLTVTTSTTQANRGDIIDVTVSISSSSKYTSVRFELQFDATVYELDETDWEYVAVPNHFESVFQAAPGVSPTVWVYGMMMNPATQYSGELLHFKLKIRSGAVFGEQQITLKNAKVDQAPCSVTAASTTVACKHNYETWTKKDDNKHTATCTICNQPIEADHTWDEGKITKTTGCETPGEKTYTCTACGATKVEEVKVTGHAWDNDCDTECNNGCGTKREITHKYSDKFTSDEKGHWYACTVCGDKHDYYEHTPDRDAPTEKEDQLCKYCGYVIAPKLGHVHDVSPQIQKDATGHWYFCTKYGCYMRFELAAHVYDNDCDIDCNVCGYIRIPPHKFMPEWRGNQEGHWHVCALCNAESEILPHNPGEPATNENPQLCTDCHFWLQWPLSHVHSYGDTWEHDEDGHWQICTECQGLSEIQEHTWDEGTVILQPTETQEGTKKFVCTVCQEEKTESIPTVTAPTEPSEQPTSPQTPGEPGEEDGFPWWIVGASAVVLLVIGIVLLIIEIIRSRKTNMHGKFSK